MGELVVDDSQTRGPDLTVKLYAPTTDTDDEAETPASSFADTLLEVIASVDGQQVPSERALLAHVRLAGHRARNTTVRDALDDLLADGRLVEVQGKRGAKGYRATSTASHGPNPSESR